VVHGVTAAFAADHPDALVVEVGAHDGIQRDPLRRHVLTSSWTTYLLEPVPTVFERLRRNVRFIPGAHPVNVAIAEEDGALPFYLVRPPGPGEDIWPWHDALGSFDKDVVLSHSELIPDIADRIETSFVPTSTGQTFMTTYGIDHIDLLQIDTEGYDLKVLEQFDIRTLRPRVVIFEHWHLDEAERSASHKLLSGAGYEIAMEGLDTIAVRDDCAGDPTTALGSAWSRLVT
jgi:FkbM family methyltransferase